MRTDTIAAIATALTDSGIGIIRVSGPEAIDNIDSIVVSKTGRHFLKSVESHTISYGYIVDSEDNSFVLENAIDEVLVSVFKAPKSYTTEDTVEINCHGGVLVMRKVLDACIKAGCRIAEPGEFTKRAFLNGRIDLSEAEAVIDLINSQNQFAYDSARHQISGSLYRKIKELRGTVIYEIAFIESALDDPEHISLDGYSERLSDIICKTKASIKELLDTADNGRLMKEGISTVILGRPNAGKSSLLNSLLGEERAIVTDIAGTTRDILEEHVLLNGIGLNIVDTAGIRDTEDVVERIGVDRAIKVADNADLIIYVVDSSVALDDSDKDIMKLLDNKNAIILLNKSDLNTIVSESDIRVLIDEIIPGHEHIDVLSVSLLSEEGIDQLRNTIERMFFSGNISSHTEIIITNARHKEALTNAYNSLGLVEQSLSLGMPEDFLSIDLMNCYSELGRIIGEEVEDDLVEEIFSKFCMGK